MPVSDISVAMELRRRRRRKRNRIIAGVVAAVVVLVLVAMWIVRSSSLLCVNTIEVHGTHLVTASQVEQAAKIPKGQPLARVNTDDVAARVTRMDIVQQAEVYRKWPHTVVIDITELKISYQVKTPGGYLWIDPPGGSLTEPQNPLRTWCGQRLHLEIVAYCETSQLSLIPFPPSLDAMLTTSRPHPAMPLSWCCRVGERWCGDRWLNLFSRPRLPQRCSTLRRLVMMSRPPRIRPLAEQSQAAVEGRGQGWLQRWTPF
ncbi:cell division protein FtsQ [Cutibacterium acnes JCM 18909]|nr:cell division protein FtsQ [Cutibacterium acnes JCM 18909]